MQKFGDYNLFYKSEINIRKQLKYPPFCDIIVFGISGTNEDEVKKVSENLYKELITNKLENIAIYKPLPAPIDKIKNKYRWRIIAKCNLNNNIIDYINKCIEKKYFSKLKITNISIDINPNNML